jgi:pyruvate kinase
MKKTKIICTIGPSVNTLDQIIELVGRGMNVARLNFSHGTHEEHGEMIALLKEARKKLGVPLAIMLDTKGPEIRVKKVKKGGLELTAGQKIWLVREGEDEETRIGITPSCILDSLPLGARLLIDNGYISTHVIAKSTEGVCIEIENDGLLFSTKGVNIPNIDLPLPAITETDLADIRFGCQQDVDYIAASFVRSPETVLSIKKLLYEERKPHIQVIAKIENGAAIAAFDAILQVSDGVMVARGDLGVEVPLSRLPQLQKMMISKGYLMGKPAITATQMLESMIHNPRPTRAEVLDVANAIYDSSSAVMLSGETAIGKYPLETVSMMQNIIDEAEQDFDYAAFFEEHARATYDDIAWALTLSAIKTAYSLRAKALFAFTKNGLTARLLSRLRPKMPIIALTPCENTYQQLALNWGIIPVLVPHFNTAEEAFHAGSKFALNNKLVSHGDIVVALVGSPLWSSDTINTILVENIGDILVRGQKGLGSSICGKIVILSSKEVISPYATRDRIIVIENSNEAILPHIQNARAVILQNHPDDIASEQHATHAAEQFEKPLITRAEGALDALYDGQLVTIDPEKALVYRGVVKK